MNYPSPPYSQVVSPPRRVGSVHVLLSWITAILTAGYMLPWAIATTRNKTNSVLIAILNLALGWTVVGWIITLIMACSGSNVPVMVVQAPAQPRSNPPRAF